jgi:hypothetical protein
MSGKRIKLNAEGKLFAPYRFLDHQYGVVILYPDTNTQIHYEIDYKCMGTTEDGDIIINVNRHQVYINEEIPDSIMYQLADEMAKCYYPLQFVLDKNATIISIPNHTDIEVRCNEFLEKAAQYYDGEIVENCKDNFTIQFSNENNIINNLEKDFIHQLFFLKIFNQYNSNLESPLLGTLYFDKVKKPIQVEGKFSLAKEYTESGKIDLVLKECLFK